MAVAVARRLVPPLTALPAGPLTLTVVRPLILFPRASTASTPAASARAGGVLCFLGASLHAFATRAVFGLGGRPSPLRIGPWASPPAGLLPGAAAGPSAPLRLAFAGLLGFAGFRTLTTPWGRPMPRCLSGARSLSGRRSLTRARSLSRRRSLSWARMSRRRSLLSRVRSLSWGRPLSGAPPTARRGLLPLALLEILVRCPAGGRVTFDVPPARLVRTGVGAVVRPAMPTSRAMLLASWRLCWGMAVGHPPIVLGNWRLSLAVLVATPFGTTVGARPATSRRRAQRSVTTDTMD
ncbi:hypothetical protein N599_09400 [Saccharopolyspora erythraea D]|nr:hypothetical protein N599_09400 [Saccharopolyspora erythraea D]